MHECASGIDTIIAIHGIFLGSAGGIQAVVALLWRRYMPIKRKINVIIRKHSSAVVNQAINRQLKPSRAGTTSDSQMTVCMHGQVRRVAAIILPALDVNEMFSLLDNTHS